MKSGIVPALVGLLLAFPAVAAAPLTDLCGDTVDAALAEFAAYDYNVPWHVARPHVANISVACADPTLPPAPNMVVPAITGEGGFADVNLDAAMGLVQDAAGGVGSPIEIPSLGEAVACSGGSMTILGWSNTVYVANVRVHFINEPASSYYTVAGQDGVITALDGHTRSEANNFEVKMVGGTIVAYWDWLNIPMLGDAGVSVRCLGPVITSVSVALSGSPPFVSGDVLRVESGGTTCLIPC